jgi:hypothetical protein
MWRGFEGVVLTQDAIERRASGRKHYNAVRTFRATLRRMEVARLLLAGWKPGHIAATLDVHPTTITRDIVRLMADPRHGPCCQACGRPYNLDVPRGYRC